MQKRRSHNKSRRGCQNCKKRHVKCDEQGPPCAACVARDADSINTCTYASLVHGHGASSRASRNTASAGLQPLDEANSASNRLLELELMHRWSYSTYKSLCSLPEDYDYMQVKIPQSAFRHPFLMHTMMAMSALDMAVCNDEIDTSVYFRAAIESYDRASGLLRAELATITKENFEAVYMASFIVTVINMVMARYIKSEDGQQESVLERMGTLFELLLGSGSIVLMNAEWLSEGPMARSTEAGAALLIKAQNEKLSSALEDVLTRLKAVVVRSVELRAAHHEDEVETEGSEPLQVAFTRALELLWQCFTVENANEPIAGFCVAFPMFIGQRFASAFKSSDPVALFITMHWAVLLDRVGNKIWWAKSVGRDLVQEISEVLMQTQLQNIMESELQAGIAWARDEVGLRTLK